MKMLGDALLNAYRSPYCAPTSIMQDHFGRVLSDRLWDPSTSSTFLFLLGESRHQLMLLYRRLGDSYAFFFFFFLRLLIRSHLYSCQASPVLFRHILSLILGLGWLVRSVTRRWSCAQIKEITKPNEKEKRRTEWKEIEGKE